MKIKTFVNIEQEVEVSVSSDDIARSISEFESHSVRSALFGVNNVATYLKGIPDACIKDMTTGQKQLIETFLREQAARYIP